MEINKQLVASIRQAYAEQAGSSRKWTAEDVNKACEALGIDSIGGLFSGIKKVCDWLPKNIVRSSKVGTVDEGRAKAIIEYIVENIGDLATMPKEKITLKNILLKNTWTIPGKCLLDALLLGHQEKPRSLEGYRTKKDRKTGEWTYANKQGAVLPVKPEDIVDNRTPQLEKLISALKAKPKR